MSSKMTGDFQRAGKKYTGDLDMSVAGTRVPKIWIIINCGDPSKEAPFWTLLDSIIPCPYFWNKCLCGFILELFYFWLHCDGKKPSGGKMIY